MQGIFISDLHLYSRRSIGQQRWESSLHLVQPSDLVVLGGDIFDLRWSQLGSLDHTQKVAEEWIEQAIAKAPSAQWVYLLGNHDCSPAFQQVLIRVAEKYSNFEWQEYHFRQGSHLFLHGDILDCGGLQRHDQYRLRYHHAKPRGLAGNLAYEVIIQSRLHRLVPTVIHRRVRTCTKLSAYLAERYPTDAEGIRHVYFGHTHVPVSTWEHQSVRFYNPGSGIRHLAYQPVLFEF